MLPIPVSLSDRSHERPLHRERWLRLLVCCPLLLGLLMALAWEEGTRPWLKAVFLQDAAAAYTLSERAQNGLGEPVDPRLARTWLVRAAHLGEPRARARLGGEVYARALVSDPEERTRLLLEAADFGEARALWALGTETRDAAQGLRWIREAAKQGSSDALLRLANYSEDPASAAELYRRAVRAARLDGRAGRWVDGLWVGEAASEAFDEHLARYPAQRRPEDAALAIPPRCVRGDEDDVE